MRSEPPGPTSVLLMAYGSPTSPDDIAEYYTDIRRVRPPTPEQLAELRERYARIGGTSPLNEITERQAAALQWELQQQEQPIRVYVGMKHWHPRIHAAIARMAADGVERAVGLVLAPHYSRLSIGDYHSRARAAIAELGAAIEYVPVDRWHLEPCFLGGVRQRVADALDRFPAALGGEVSVLFTAHSLPERILAEGDPYPTQLAEPAEAVAGPLGIHRWSIAWQSAGRTPEPWLGPDVRDAITQQARAGARMFLVCPVGFTADHLEVLYDLDVECRAHADSLGVAFERTDSPNDEPELIAALAGVVRARLQSGATA